jgi:DNA polymerase elongation subunit (family B)
MEDKDLRYKKLDLKQLAIKLLINSIYGAFGNKWFYFFNTDIAQSITLQGQDLIKFTIKAVNFYFKERWHLDKELHEHLGISKYEIEKVEDEAAIYTDTDSIYVQFGSAIKSIKGMQELTDEEYLNICIKIDEFRLAEYFNKCFDKYGTHFNTDNRQNFELENLSIKGLWLKKKNYALQVSYEPNHNKTLLRNKSNESDYEVFKGLEMIKSSYPIWARNHLETFTKLILEKGYSIDIEKDLIPRLEDLKKEISLKSIDELAFNFNCRVYNKYVKSEKKLELIKGIPIYARAASYYNHLLIKNGLLGKYSKIREGNKIKYYFPSSNEFEFDVFAYSPGSFPEEIAVPIDYNKQFFSLIVEPINRQLKALGMNELNVHLNRNVEMVKTGTRKALTEEEMYPLFVINTKTLQYNEIPEKFWKIIGDPKAKVPDDAFNEYIDIISKYGLDTKIVPSAKLQAFRKRTAKRLGIELEEVTENVEQIKLDI